MNKSELVKLFKLSFPIEVIQKKDFKNVAHFIIKFPYIELNPVNNKLPELHCELILDNDINLLLPFKEILIDIPVSFNSFNGNWKNYYYITQSDKTTFINGLSIYSNTSLPYKIYSSLLIIENKFVETWVLMKPEILQYKIIFKFYNNRYFEESKIVNEVNTMKIASEHLKILSLFLEYVNIPTNHIVKVLPNDNKSVKWIDSKSHYLLLDHSASEYISKGKAYKFDGTITRSMHARRAHYRTLTSSRFSKKQGQKVWIKQAWVGPKEWIGTDKKIYKIVDTDLLIK